MIPAKFEYTKAESVAEAISLLGKHDDAKLLAGGHSLVPAMKLRLNQPAMLIDIGGIAELNSITEEGDQVVVGANCTHAQIAASDVVKKHATALAEAAGAIGDLQVRNAGTIAGSIAHADPAADYPAVIMAYDATITVEGPNGSRDIAAAEFFKGFFETEVSDDEVITSISFPKSSAGAYLKFANAASRYAVVGCAVIKTSSGVQVGLTGVADAAYRASKVEEAFTGSNAEEAAAHAVDGVDVMEDHYASSKYRSHLAKVFVKRALESI